VFIQLSRKLVPGAPIQHRPVNCIDANTSELILFIRMQAAADLIRHEKNQDNRPDLLMKGLKSELQIVSVSL